MLLNGVRQRQGQNPRELPFLNEFIAIIRRQMHHHEYTQSIKVSVCWNLGRINQEATRKSPDIFDSVLMAFYTSQ